MNRVSTLRQQIYGGEKDGAFEKPLQKRFTSLPALRRKNSMPEDKRYVPGENIPSRSVSLTYKVNGVQRIPRLIQPIDGCNSSSAADATEDDDAYDSDEEDRKNGIPISYTQDDGVPFDKGMEAKLAAQIQDQMAVREQLKPRLQGKQRKYGKLRRKYFQGAGSTWTARQWESFLYLEDAWYDLELRMGAMEDSLRDAQTMAILLHDDGKPPRRAHWGLEGGESLVYASSGNYEKWRELGDRVPLRYIGVDYNRM